MAAKKVHDIAIGWLKNTTVAPEKIADHLGIHGESKKKFLVYAKQYREKLWGKEEINE